MFRGVHTYIYYTENYEIKTIEVEGEEFFNYIKRVLPEKDFEVVKHTQQAQSRKQLNTSSDDIEGRLLKLKQLYESGLINEVEYEQKRKELLDSL